MAIFDVAEHMAPDGGRLGVVPVRGLGQWLPVKPASTSRQWVTVYAASTSFHRAAHDLDPLAERICHVESAHRYVEDEGEREAEQEPQRPEQDPHGDDGEQGDSRCDRESATYDERGNDVALELLHDDDNAERPK